METSRHGITRKHRVFFDPVCRNEDWRGENHRCKSSFIYGDIILLVGR